jgi:hypothetical protein
MKTGTDPRDSKSVATTPESARKAGHRTGSGRWRCQASGESGSLAACRTEAVRRHSVQRWLSDRAQARRTLREKGKRRPVGLRLRPRPVACCAIAPKLALPLPRSPRPAVRRASSSAACRTSPRPTAGAVRGSGSPRDRARRNGIRHVFAQLAGKGTRSRASRASPTMPSIRAPSFDVSAATCGRRKANGEPPHLRRGLRGGGAAERGGLRAQACSRSRVSTSRAKKAAPQGNAASLKS